MEVKEQTEQLNTEEESEVKEQTAEDAAEASPAEIPQTDEPLKNFEGRTVEPPKKS